MVCGNSAVVDLIAQLVHLTTEKEKVDLVALALVHLKRSVALLLLSLFVCLDGVFVGCLETLLLVYKFVSGLIELVNVIAEVLWGRKLEKIGVESGHLGLNVIEEVSLDHVRTVNANGNFLEKLCNGEVLRTNALLN